MLAMGNRVISFARLMLCASGSQNNKVAPQLTPKFWIHVESPTCRSSRFMFSCMGRTTICIGYPFLHSRPKNNRKKTKFGNGRNKILHLRYFSQIVCGLVDPITKYLLNKSIEYVHARRNITSTTILFYLSTFFNCIYSCLYTLRLIWRRHWMLETFILFLLN